MDVDHGGHEFLVEKKISRYMAQEREHGYSPRAADHLKTFIHDPDVIDEFWVMVVSPCAEHNRVDDVGDGCLDNVGQIERFIHV